MPLTETWFHRLHPRTLVYNACCEDPALDCEALELTAADRVLVITSGGCNALAYLLAGAGEVTAVDVNPCQNALLEFKVAALQQLDFVDLWEIFGRGKCVRVREIYRDVLRASLSPAAQQFWDRRLHLFVGTRLRPTFYHRGSWGTVTWLIQSLWKFRGLRAPIEQLFATKSLDEQWEIYQRRLRPHLWKKWFCWLATQSLTHSLMGIPPRQRAMILQYPGGLHTYGQNLIDELVRHVPFSSNYFMHVNALGSYTPQCCPDYLTRDGFDRLKRDLATRLHIHTSTVTQYLQNSAGGYTKLVLLDHMDWLDVPALQTEWEAILTKAAPGATVLFRSAQLEVDYLEPLSVTLPDVHGGRKARLGELLQYDRAQAKRLHQRDRVHLYGSFSIARLGAL